MKLVLASQGFTTEEIESLIQYMFDSAQHSSYAYLYLIDTSIIANSVVDDIYKTDNGNFVMLFSDTNGYKVNGVKSVKASNSFITSPIFTDIFKKVTSDNGKVYVSQPNKLNFVGNDFLGLNIAVPIVNAQNKVVGILGSTFDFADISKQLTDEDLDVFEHDIRTLVTDTGMIAIHGHKDFISKNIKEINPDPSVEKILSAIRNHQDQVFDDYIDSSGNLSIASISSFSTLDESSYWSILVTAPMKAVLAPMYKLQNIIITAAFIFLVVVLSIIAYSVRMIVGLRLPILLNGLISFFKYINHETNNVSLITIRSNDELGAMGVAINENIKRIRKSKGLSQEELAIKLNVVRQTVSKWENGLSVPDSSMLIILANELDTTVSELLGEPVAEPTTDDLKILSEKLEVINLQLAKRSITKVKTIRWILISLCAVIVVIFIALASTNSFYLNWNYNDPELAVAGTILHGFEFLFVRLAPIVFLTSVVGVVVTYKKR